MYETGRHVSGFLLRILIVQNPRAIGRITFDEIRELSYGRFRSSGGAISPVREANTNSDQNTTVRRHENVIRETAGGDANEHLITGIAGRKRLLNIHVKKAHMSNGLASSIALSTLLALRLC